MVSKNKYYELKAQGLCVKCGKERGDSPSEVRCTECHERYLETKKSKKEERLESGLCIQCGKTALLGHSKYCSECREKNASYKKLIEKPISLYKENNDHCRLCNGLIDTLGIVCQKCLDQVQFTKLDAIIRYNEQCVKCYESDPEKLVFASIDISVPMKHTGPELYRYICFSTSAPKDYVLMCNSCYWQCNFDYIKNLRSILLNNSTDADDITTDADEVITGTVSGDDETVEDQIAEEEEMEEEMEEEDDKLD